VLQVSGFDFKNCFKSVPAEITLKYRIECKLKLPEFHCETKKEIKFSYSRYTKFLPKKNPDFFPLYKSSFYFKSDLQHCFSDLPKTLAVHTSSE